MPNALITSEITSEQKEQFLRVVSDAAREATFRAIEELVKAGKLDRAGFQRVLAQGSAGLFMISTMREKIAKMAEGVTGYLKCISIGKEIILAPMDGTESTKAQVYELIKNGTFKDIFGSFGENLDRSCFKRGQIELFCKEHTDQLRTDSAGTFFLFKNLGEYFVVCKYWNSGELREKVECLSYDHVWHAEGRPRFVFPQL